MDYYVRKQVLLPDAGFQIFGADAAEDDPNLSSYFLQRFAMVWRANIA
jgi:hypothetical protein